MCSISQHILIIVRKSVFMLVAYGTVQAYDPLGLYLLMVALMGCFLDLSKTVLCLQSECTSCEILAS